MAKNITNMSKGKGHGNSNMSNEKSHSNIMFLDEVCEGSSGTIMVMVCRKWDVTSVNSRYMSTDYIVSDQKGNFLHCVARKNVSHLFVDRLKEGCLYFIRGFGVESRSQYMLLEGKPMLITLKGDTVVTKANVDVDGFPRHPFKLTAFEDLQPNDNQFFVDVVGYVTSVGEPSMKANGAQTVEFSLCSERNRQVRVTLWGALGEAMIKKKAANPGIYPIILTSMSTKSYLNNVGLSSSSSTLLIDSDDVPALKTFKSLLSTVNVGEYSEPITEETPIVRTLKELLDRSRDGMGKKKIICFENKVEIIGVRTKNSWYIFTCNGGKCRKGLEREDGAFKCVGCKSKVDYPRTRYRLELDVTDGEMTSVVVLFDETAEKLVGRSAKSLVEDQSMNTSIDSPVLPPAIESIVGTKHVFQIKSHTCYHFGDYESFNCARILGPIVGESGVKGVSDGMVVKSNLSQPSSSDKLNVVDSIDTPVKENERKSRKHRIVVSDSVDLNESEVNDSVTPVKKTVKRRLVKVASSTDEDVKESPKLEDESLSNLDLIDSIEKPVKVNERKSRKNHMVVSDSEDFDESKVNDSITPDKKTIKRRLVEDTSATDDNVKDAPDNQLDDDFE